MSFADSLFFLMLLVAGSVFFSLSEISLAASRKIKLQVMADEGNRHAEKVLALFAPLGATGAERYEMPNLAALNFVLTGTLGGGVTRSLALDAHGKALSGLLLELEL